MSTSRDAPNPLRPYYVPPPSFGTADPSSHDAGSGNSSSSHFYYRRSPTPPPHTSRGAAGRSRLGASARDILSDLDYDEIVGESGPATLADWAKRLADQAVWNYTSVFLSQPFEVAKLVLQCRMISGQELGPGGVVVARGTGPGVHSDDLNSSDSDPENPSYFTSTTPSASRQHASTRRRPATPPRSESTTPTPPSSRRAQQPPIYHPYQTHRYKLALRRPDSLLEILAQLWSKESAWGVWKGTNVSFVLNVLQRTVESWTRSLLAALLNLPDPGSLSGSAGSSRSGGALLPGGSLDVADSPSPWVSVGVVVAAAGIAGLVLAPLDIIRTRLIITPSSPPSSSSSPTSPTSLTQSSDSSPHHQPRTLIPSLRALPTLLPHPTLLTPTFLHATLPSLLAASAPLLLRSAPLRIDPLHSPSAYSAATFLAALAELAVKLPLELVLRRAQVAVLQEWAAETQQPQQAPLKRKKRAVAPSSGSRGRQPRRVGEPSPSPRSETGAAPSDEDAALPTVVDVGPYRGVFGSLWFVVRDEGVSVVGPPPPLRGGGKRLGPTPMSGMAGQQRLRKGQGPAGLWRGWRVGFWGLVGVWGAAALGGAGGGEF
ncbi:hypothetical protein BDY21DRAFT_386902 [Lineolata rhizophorae]|uniref:Mitochondrial carrier domain-containing protein n=1 Tax=Lineolata rhizophorae TaxID=578093 RepID=A0A6A6NVR9_9PEZI|nr:hypothetical protein BDY21DRAFT_386902 [Lineolata rhizophorae]